MSGAAMKLARLIKGRRDELSLSSRSLAKRAGVSTGHIANIESGRTSNLTVLMAARLAETLNLGFHKVVDAARESAEEAKSGD